MINKINLFLYKFFGYRLTKTQTGFEVKKISKTQTKPLYIEFVGAFGVGKTTLFNNLNNERNKSWVVASDYIYLNRKMINREIIESAGFYYQELAKYCMVDLMERKILPTDKMSKFNFLHSKLLEEIFILLNNKEFTIINDDGFLHNCTNAFIKLYNYDKALFEQSIKHRIVVYCYTSPDVLANQILKRQKETGFLSIFHTHENLTELINKQKVFLDEKRELISLLKKYNRPILNINTSDPLEENCRKVKEFILKNQNENI